VNRQEHWDTIHTTKGERDRSWFEPSPDVSMKMIASTGLVPNACVIDVGGGDSRLVDALLSAGVRCVAVLDVSSAALEHAKTRLGSAAESVTWIASDVTGEWSVKPMDVWHDRAVFHFLTDPDDRKLYLARLRQTLKVNGNVIIATFALDGPSKCSGLPIARYSADTLSHNLDNDFELVDTQPHTHVTPWGASQSFQYSRFKRLR
jgi:hypothetical protein